MDLTRDLPDGKSGVIPASTVQASSLTELADRTAWVVQAEQDIKEQGCVASECWIIPENID